MSQVPEEYRRSHCGGKGIEFSGFVYVKDVPNFIEGIDCNATTGRKALETALASDSLIPYAPIVRSPIKDRRVASRESPPAIGSTPGIHWWLDEMQIRRYTVNGH